MTIVTSAADSVPIPTSRDVPWQKALKDAIRDPAQLCALLQLPPTFCTAARQAAQQFPLLVPREYASRMRMGDPHDPLLRQVLPVQEELNRVPGFHRDPVGDTAAILCPGLLQKYAGRALIVATAACAVHCRYCFRRHFCAQHPADARLAWQPVLEQLAGNRQIREIILSGGDPLLLPDRRLRELGQQLAAIGHLQRLRIHTRLPVVIPQRVTNTLVQLLRENRLTPIVVIHANHPAELDKAVAAALGRLVDAGIPVLNQSVLLRGVNDSVETLATLNERLINIRVMPYYLHRLDPVAGAAHFHVPQETGRQLLTRLRAQLPGYAVPRFVCEQPGHPCKVPLA